MCERNIEADGDFAEPSGITVGLICEILNSLMANYNQLDKKIRIIDIFILFCSCNMCCILCYAVLIGTTYPYNSLLAAFYCQLGLIAFSVSLRSRIRNIMEFKDTYMLALEYTLCVLFLFLAVVIYIG